MEFDLIVRSSVQHTEAHTGLVYHRLQIRRLKDGWLGIEGAIARRVIDYRAGLYGCKAPVFGFDIDIVFTGIIRNENYSRECTVSVGNGTSVYHDLCIRGIDTTGDADARFFRLKLVGRVVDGEPDVPDHGNIFHLYVLRSLFAI